MRKSNRIGLVLKSCTVLGLAISKPVAAVTMYSITDLGDYNFLIPEGNSINDNGQVVGNWSSFDNYGLQAFVWDSTDGRQNLGTLIEDSFFYSKATSINDKTQVVGDSATRIDAEPGYDPRAFLWESTNGIQNLGSLSSISSIGDSFATDINNQGQVVGYSRITAGASHAFLWDSINGMQDIGTLYPSSIGNPSFALGINDKGQVVGTSYSPETDSHAFVWENGVMTDLNTLVDPSFGFTLSQAQAINNKGQIVATSLLTSSVRAFVLTPIEQPEPIPEATSTLGLLAFGAVAAGSVFKRKQRK